MNNLQVLAIGAFTIAAGHYAHDGESGWYAVWVIMGVSLTVIIQLLERVLSSKYGDKS